MTERVLARKLPRRDTPQGNICNVYFARALFKQITISQCKGLLIKLLNSIISYFQAPLLRKGWLWAQYLLTLTQFLYFYLNWVFIVNLKLCFKLSAKTYRFLNLHVCLLVLLCSSWVRYSFTIFRWLPFGANSLGWDESWMNYYDLLRHLWGAEDRLRCIDMAPLTLTLTCP